eukprot:gene30851-35891_t
MARSRHCRDGRQYRATKHGCSGGSAQFSRNHYLSHKSVREYPSSAPIDPFLDFFSGNVDGMWKKTAKEPSEMLRGNPDDQQKVADPGPIAILVALLSTGTASEKETAAENMQPGVNPALLHHTHAMQPGVDPALLHDTYAMQPGVDPALLHDTYARQPGVDPALLHDTYARQPGVNPALLYNTYARQPGVNPALLHHTHARQPGETNNLLEFHVKIGTNERQKRKRCSCPVGRGWPDSPSLALDYSTYADEKSEIKHYSKVNLAHFLTSICSFRNYDNFAFRLITFWNPQDCPFGDAPGVFANFEPSRRMRDAVTRRQLSSRKGSPLSVVMLTTRKLQPLPLLLVYACLAASPSVARAQEPATSLPPWCQPPPAPPSPPSPPYTLCDSPSHLIFSLQWQALQYFYNATQGGSWVNNSGWADAREYNNNTCYLPFDEDNPFPSFCCWYGITCCMSKVCLGGGFNCLCSTRGAVMEMDLRNNNLVGPLAFHDWTVQDSVILEALACDLKIILLSTNSLTGTIPDAVSQMQSVEIIGFGGNQLEGTIPSGVGRLESLKRLDLTNNKLTGSLPDGLCVRMSPSGFKESVITDILVSGNSLTGLTPSLCPALVYLEANSNRLSGSMGTLGTFPELHILDLSNNLISGIVPTPEAWGELMISVNLQNNRMTGSLPENFSTIWYLTDLNVGGNLLNGTIPPSIFSRIGSLTSLNIAGNCSAALGQYDTTPSCITGTIPDKIRLVPLFSSLTAFSVRRFSSGVVSALWPFAYTNLGRVASGAGHEFTLLVQKTPRFYG